MPPVHWQVAYDRGSVDRFIAEVEAERSRLQGQIETTREHLRQARAAAARQEDAQAELAARFLAVQEELETIERQHRISLDAIGAEAAQAAARLLAAARKEAEAMRAAGATVAALRDRPGQPFRTSSGSDGGRTER